MFEAFAFLSSLISSLLRYDESGSSTCERHEYFWLDLEEEVALKLCRNAAERIFSLGGEEAVLEDEEGDGHG